MIDEEFSLLTHKLPTSRVIDGIEYFLDTRTTKALQAIFLLSHEEIPTVDRLDMLLRMLVRNYDDITAETVDGVEDFVADFLKGYPKTVGGRPQKQEVMSYAQDHDLIVSSFREAYGFSLEEIQAMHYWLFLAYLNGLPSTTRLANVMQIRLTTISSKDSAEVRNAKIRAKQAVALRPRHKLNAETGKKRNGMDIISSALEEEDRNLNG